MRLDHLLSKETSGKANAFSSNVLRSVQSDKYFTLFNLEGTALKKSSEFRGLSSELRENNSAFSTKHSALERSERNGPIAQLARAHD